MYCSICFLQVGVYLFVCSLLWQTVVTYWSAFTYPCGGEEQGMEPYCYVDRRCSDGIWCGSRSRRLCLVESQSTPCQGATLCPDTYLPSCCCSGSPGLKLTRLFIAYYYAQWCEEGCRSYIVKSKTCGHIYMWLLNDCLELICCFSSSQRWWVRLVNPGWSSTKWSLVVALKVQLWNLPHSQFSFI